MAKPLMRTTLILTIDTELSDAALEDSAIELHIYPVDGPMHAETARDVLVDRGISRTKVEGDLTYGGGLVVGKSFIYGRGGLVIRAQGSLQILSVEGAPE